MIFGIGCDVCALDHLEKSLSGPHAAAFVRRVYGPAECTALALDTPQPAGHRRAHRLASAAANFAAKEAFLKAAGTGLREPFSLCEIEAVRLESGAPAYRFSGKPADWVPAHRLTARLSLSHEGGMALAFCTLEQPETWAPCLHTMEYRPALHNRPAACSY